MEAVDTLRDEGEKVGVIKLRLWRPFPFDEFRKAALGKKYLIVLDRAISFGGPGGPVASELRSALYKKDGAPTIVNYIAGLAGRDVSRKDFRNIILAGKNKAQEGDTEGFTLYGLRG
jgi:pyruvate ferredoxin oxidoreductase alpha subunit